MGKEKQGEAPFRWRCPACGVWAEESLVQCGGCQWADAAGAQRARLRLAVVNRSGSSLAFLRTGCRVCRTCGKQFRERPQHCPLYLFYFGLRAWASSRKIASPVDAQNAMRVLLDQSLEERNYPEEVEAYWRRLLARLERTYRDPGQKEQR